MTARTCVSLSPLYPLDTEQCLAHGMYSINVGLMNEAKNGWGYWRWVVSDEDFWDFRTQYKSTSYAQGAECDFQPNQTLFRKPCCNDNCAICLLIASEMLTAFTLLEEDIGGSLCSGAFYFSTSLQSQQPVLTGSGEPTKIQKIGLSRPSQSSAIATKCRSTKPC